MIAATRSGSRFRLPGAQPIVRDPDEEHRAATPLELLFDLCFVVGVAQAAAAYHHELVAGHIADGLGGFTAGFFAIWWGWMNFTWFSTAHDADDVVHRLLTLVQMAGALILAAGVARAVEDGDFEVAVLGYVVMRVGLVAAWLRVAARHPEGRARCLRFAVGLVVVQALWVAFLAVPDDLRWWAFAVLVLVDVTVPLVADRAADGPPPFHAHHIEERYGLFTIIVLGESILSATVGFQGAVDDGGLSLELALVGIGGLVLAFGAWWLYFDHPGHLSPSSAVIYRWGYGHIVVFAALAALGAGVFVAIEAVSHHAEARTAALAVTGAVAAYLWGIVLLLVLTGRAFGDIRVWPKLSAGALVLAIGAVASVPVAVVGSAVVMAALVAWMVAHGGRGTVERPR